MRDNTWKLDASCRTDDGSLNDAFFGPEPDPTSTRREGAAKAERLDLVARICGGCPVRTECFEFANSYRVEYGIWAGIEADEIGKRRRRIERGIRETKTRAV